MTNTQKTPEQIVKAYKKGNQEYKKSLLKKYGIKDISRINEVLAPKAKEVICTKAELSKILLNHPVVNLTVSFQKPAKEKDVFNELLTLHRFPPPEIGGYETNLRIIVKEAINGIERVVEGSHNNRFDYNGRLFMTDKLQKQKPDQMSDSRMILVTLSNINWIEIGNKLYKLK